MKVGHQHVGKSCETVQSNPVDGEEGMTAWVRTIKETIAVQNKLGWTNDEIGIFPVRPNFSDVYSSMFKLRERLEEEQFNPKFDFETLSQEWPVVLICLPNSKKENLSIGQSRAIGKLIYIKPSSNIRENWRTVILNDNRVSHLSLTTACLKAKMEFFAYHQEMHGNSKLIEERTYKAFIEDINQKVSIARGHTTTQMGESIRWIINAFLIFVSLIVK